MTRAVAGRLPRRALAAGVVAGVVAAVGVASCGGTETAAGDGFTPAQPGVLTVATAVVPAPGLWEPDGAGAYRGFEAGLADALADHLGAGSVRVVVVPFPDLVAGRFGEADVAVSALTPTGEREAGADFTVPYLDAPPAVVVREGAEARDAAELRALRWVVIRGSTLTSAVEDRIRPDEAPDVVEDRAAGLDAVRAGEADAVLVDLPVAQGVVAAEADGSGGDEAGGDEAGGDEAGGDDEGGDEEGGGGPDGDDEGGGGAGGGRLVVAGRLSDNEGLAVALPEGSDDLDAVDAAVRRLRADGTVADLEARWLGPAGDVPLIRVDR